MTEKKSKKLERLLAKKDELLKKINDLKKDEIQKSKEYINKKKQVLGGFFLNHYKNRMDDLKRMLDPVLKKVGERKMFGLEVKTEEKKESEKPQEKNSYSKPFSWKVDLPRFSGPFLAT